MQKLKKLFPLVGALLALALVSCGSDSDSDSKTAGSISYAIATVSKTTDDEPFTNELTKTGDGTVSYASSKETVATVNATTGEVTIVGAGEATITATVADSDTYTYATKTASYTLTVTQAVTYIGTKAPTEAKAVGDIVFSDGSATPYADGLTLTAEQKEAAISVIFYAGTGLNSGDDTTTSRTLGVGLAQNQSGLAWCVSGAKANSRDITTIQCPAIGSAGSLTFTGDRNGSDNLSQIGDFLGGNDDTESEASYPAFYFAKNYKSQTGSRVSGTDYESGWYLPSIAELFQIWTKMTDLNKAIALCAGTEFDLSKYYWSSSQYASTGTIAYDLYFSDGGWGSYPKGFTDVYVCAVRAFN